MYALSNDAEPEDVSIFTVKRKISIAGNAVFVILEYDVSIQLLFHFFVINATLYHCCQHHCNSLPESIVNKIC